MVLSILALIEEMAVNMVKERNIILPVTKNQMRQARAELVDMNAYSEGGASYGVFDNSNSKATQLGAVGFTRGSYTIFLIPVENMEELAGMLLPCFCGGEANKS